MTTDPKPENSADMRFGRINQVPRDEWLARAEPEDVIDPDRKIVDAHQHFWINGDHTYLLPGFMDDVQAGGHRIVSTVFVECGQMYRQSGPEAFRPVGEVEFANGIAAMSASGRFGTTKAAHGIVGKADLTLGAGIRPVLECMIDRAGDRFVGLRTQNNFHPDPVIGNTDRRVADMLYDDGFRQGLRELGKLGRAFDLWVFHPQLNDALALVKALPDVRFVLGHCGGPLGYGPYRGRHDDVFEAWRPAMQALAECPNVWVKLGGIINRLASFNFHDAEKPIHSSDLSDQWRPWITTTIDLFGADRCLFESNFPVEKFGCTYRTVWNAFKRLTADCSNEEKDKLFRRSAETVYRLPH